VIDTANHRHQPEGISCRNQIAPAKPPSFF